ncbi:MAG: hypothetical protein QM756_06620 [Polyangiaceae bacterium]
MLLAVVIATLAVLFGLLLGLAPAASRRALGPLRTLAFTAVIGVVALHLLPEALRDLGAVGLLVFAAGLALPRWLSAVRGGHAHGDAAELGLDLGFLGLLVHHVGDGLALGAYSRAEPAAEPHAHAHTDVLLALVLHTVPLVAVVAAGYARTRGLRVAITRSAALAVASVVGVLGLALGAEHVGRRRDGLDCRWRVWFVAARLGARSRSTICRALLSARPSIWAWRCSASRSAYSARGWARTPTPRWKRACAWRCSPSSNRTALPLTAGLALGALLSLGQSQKLRSLLGGYMDAARPQRGGVLTPEAFLLTLSHFGFALALLRDLLAAFGLSVRGAPTTTEWESPRSELFRRIDIVVPWAALGVLVAAVIRASVPEFALASPTWLALLGAVAFALSVKVHAVAAPALALAVADRGLPLPAALVLMLLTPFALDLRNARHWLFIAIPSGLALAFGDRVPRALLASDSSAATLAAAVVGVVLLLRAYWLGFRGLLRPIVRAD